VTLNVTLAPVSKKLFFPVTVILVAPNMLFCATAMTYVLPVLLENERPIGKTKPTGLPQSSTAPPLFVTVMYVIPSVVSTKKMAGADVDMDVEVNTV
jgi:hypothetical protein